MSTSCVSFQMMIALLAALMLFLAPICSAANACTGATLQKTQTALSPNTGLVLWQDTLAKTTFKQSITLEFSYFNIDQLVSNVVFDANNVPTITYDWVQLEKFLNQCKTNGHSAVIRVRDQDPSESVVTEGGVKMIKTFIPPSIKALSDYNETFQNEQEESDQSPTDVRYYFPDWSSIKLQQFYLTFFKEFGQAYDNDERLAYLQVGFGNWGEGHIYPYKITLGTNYPSYSYSKQWIQNILTSFTATPVQFSIDMGSSSYTQFATDTSIQNLPTGLIDDSFMIENHGGYNTQQWNKLNQIVPKGSSTQVDRWTVAPYGGEISYASTEQQDFLDPAGMFDGKMKWVEQALLFHLTYMIANDAPTNKTVTPTVYKAGSAVIGYKFAITEIIAVPSTQTLTIAVTNTGIAPPYHHYYIKVGGKTSTQSLRLLQPNQSMAITISDIDLSNISTTPLDLIFTSPKVYSTTAIEYTADCTYVADGSDSGNSAFTVASHILTLSTLAILSCLMF